VHRTFTKSIGNLRYTYHERLSILKIDSLLCGRLKADLIMCYQCCSQGQNPKAKDEAKAWTLEAKTKTKARPLESDRPISRPHNDSQFKANIPHAIDMTIAPIS